MNGSRGGCLKTSRTSVCADRQALAGADEERHAAPSASCRPRAAAPRRSRSSSRAATPSMLPVAVVLAADVARRVGVGDRAEDAYLASFSVSASPPAGGSIAVAASTCSRWLTTTSRSAPTGIVEAAAILDAEVLGHRDLHQRDVVAVPDRLEHRVREAQVQDLLERPSCRGSGRSGRAGTRRGTCADRAASARAEARSWPNGFSTTTRCPLATQVVPRQPRDHGREQRRRDLEVEGREAGAHRAPRPAARRSRVAEVAADVSQPLGEAREHARRRASRRPARSPRARARAGARRPVVGRDADHRQVEDVRGARAGTATRSVIFCARSPVIPNTTSASALRLRVAHRRRSYPTLRLRAPAAARRPPPARLRAAGRAGAAGGELDLLLRRPRLEHAGQTLEARLGQEHRAAALAELAFADPRVAVAVGAQRRHRVVQVQRLAAGRDRRRHRTRRASRRGPHASGCRSPMRAGGTSPGRRRVAGHRRRHRAAPPAPRRSAPGSRRRPRCPRGAAGSRSVCAERLADHLAGALDRVDRRRPASPSRGAGRPRRRRSRADAERLDQRCA